MPIIAGIDQSDRAKSVIRQASQLASDAGVELHIVHVGEPLLPHPQGGFDPEQAEFLSEQKATQIAREAGQEFLEEDEFRAVGLQGDPAEELLEYADQQDAVYIVVSARKRTPVGQAVFGSVTQSLLLHAQCPVVATPHTSE